MTTRNATDLVWLYSNLRLLKRTQALEQGVGAEVWVAVKEEEEQQRQQQRSEDSANSAEEECWSDEDSE
jgi:hypothetical protein